MRRRRRWSRKDALLSEGPICAAVLDVKAAVLQATRDVHDARRLLELPVRVSEEANMRAMLFYFWCKQTGPGTRWGRRGRTRSTLSDWEATLNTLDHAVHTFVVEEGAGLRVPCASAAPEIAPRLEHLERIVFHARRLARIATEIVPAPSPQSDTVSEWLPEVGVFCQSDLIQKKCRSYISSSPYRRTKWKRATRPTPFRASAPSPTRASTSSWSARRRLFRRWSRRARKSTPRVRRRRTVCILRVFCAASVRSTFLVHTLHDAHAARDGSFLLETRDQIYLRVRGKWEAPTARPGAP